MLIKWNPRIETAEDKEACLKALPEIRIRYHHHRPCPHTLGETKALFSIYCQEGTMVLHFAQVCWSFYKQGEFHWKNSEKDGAIILLSLQVWKKRGYSGRHFCRLDLRDLNSPMTVKDNLLVMVLYRRDSTTFQNCHQSKLCEWKFGLMTMALSKRRIKGMEFKSKPEPIKEVETCMSKAEN